MGNFYCYNLENKLLTKNLSLQLYRRFGQSMPTIICLGSDKVLSDMVGVLVGDKLKQLGIKTFVFGDSCHTVELKNLEFLLSKIQNKNILYIDSGISKNKGNIFFCPDGIRLKNGKKYSGASICAGTIYLENNKIMLANTSYRNIVKYVEIIVQSIINYANFITQLNKYSKF